MLAAGGGGATGEAGGEAAPTDVAAGTATSVASLPRSGGGGGGGGGATGGPVAAGGPAACKSSGKASDVGVTGTDHQDRQHLDHRWSGAWLRQDGPQRRACLHRQGQLRGRHLRSQARARQRRRPPRVGRQPVRDAAPRQVGVRVRRQHDCRRRRRCRLARQHTRREPLDLRRARIKAPTNFSTSPIDLAAGGNGTDKIFRWFKQNDKVGKGGIIWPAQASARNRAQAYIKDMEAAGISVPSQLRQEVSITETNYSGFAAAVANQKADIIISVLEVNGMARLAQRVPDRGLRAEGAVLRRTVLRPEVPEVSRTRRERHEDRCRLLDHRGRAAQGRRRTSRRGIHAPTRAPTPTTSRSRAGSPPTCS